MEFDVRQNRGTIDVIRVADKSEGWYNVTELRWNSSVVTLLHDGTRPALRLVSKEDAKNLIAGIEKAIELGWLKD